MLKFKHILLTRFNIKMESMVADRRGQAVRTREWLEKRTDLFLRYCLPSVEEQVCKDFEWLIYFDQETLQDLEPRLIERLSATPHFHIRHATSLATLSTVVRQDIQALLKPEQDYLITSRLDNDDCVHRDFIARIQQASATEAQMDGQQDLAINLLYGYRLQLTPEYLLTKLLSASGPFISLVEKLGTDNPIQTIWSGQHDAFDGDPRYRFVQIRDGRYWMQLIHETNLVNASVGQPSWSSAPVAAFGLNPALVVMKPHVLAAATAQLIPSMAKRLPTRLRRMLHPVRP